MEIAASDLAGLGAYKLLTGCVVPRPIAWISSVSDKGVVNLAPFSCYTIACTDPPMLGVSIGPRGKGQPWKPAPAPLAEQDKARMLRIGTGPSSSLLAAVLDGLICHPQHISRHADALARLQPDNPDTCALIDALLVLSDAGQPLESETLRTILLERGLRPPSAQDYAGMRFGFLVSGGDSAGDELAEAIAILVEWPAVEEALAEANKRVETELSEENFAEQQRLIARSMALRARLGQMGRARAAL